MLLWCAHVGIKEKENGAAGPWRGWNHGVCKAQEGKTPFNGNSPPAHRCLI